MKILMLAPQPFFTPRGTPISVYQRLEACSALGYEVDLLTYPLGQDVPMPNLRIIRSWGPRSLKHVPIGPSFVKILLDIFLFLKAVRLLGIGRYDVLHTHEEAAFMGLILAPLFRMPHLYDMHSRLSQQLAGSRFGRLKPLVVLFGWLERLAVKQSAGVITIGSDLADFVGSIRSKTPYCTIENMAVRSSEIVAPTLVAELAARHDIREGFIRFVYTGTFESYQGLELLLASAVLVKEQMPDVQFVLVGGRPDQVRHWQERVQTAGLAEAFCFTGVVPLAEAISFLELADVLLSPRTVGLSIPLKIYSYLHSGRPIVATQIEAHTQILDESIARIVEPTPEAFAQALVELAENAELRQAIGHRAAEFARVRFDTTSYQERVKLILEAVVYQRYRVLEQKQPMVLD